MARLGRITNANKDIQDKVNYFIDRFHHMTIYGGRENALELETQLSLMEKIYFNLTTDPNYKREIFEVYFSHKLITIESLWAEIPSYAKVLPIFKLYLGAPKKTRHEILNSSTLERDLDKVLEELRFKTPDILFEALMSIILCKHPLDEHDHIQKLDSIAQLIVSEAYFSGKTMSEINEAVNRIFEKEISLFPFPTEIKRSEKQRYMAQNNLRNQLSGFKRMMQSNIHKGFVIMKAYTVERFPEDFEFKYNSVQFFGKEHPKIKEIKTQFEKDRDFANFFNIGDFIFVSTNIEYFTESAVAQHMIDATRDQINYLSAALNSEVQLDKANHYILLNNRWKYLGYSIGLSAERPLFLKKRLAALSNNPFHILSKYRGKRPAEWFLKHEPLFVQAHKDKRISFYWQYLEALLPEDNKGNKQIRDLLPKLLLTNEQQNTQNRIVETLYNALDFFNGGYKILEIPFEELHKVRALLGKNKLHKAILNCKYPFIEQLVSEFYKTYKDQNRENEKLYYLGILIEAYNIRNFDVHAGHFHSKSVLRIQRSLPNMVVRIRWILLDAIKKNPEVPFYLLIDKLTRQKPI